MRNDVTELKKLVHEIMNERPIPVNPAPAPTQIYPTAPQNGVELVDEKHQAPKKEEDDEELQDAAELIEEPISIGDAEKELIRRALARHHGKRKGAAKDLSISERTLYRKIKEYGLDEEE
jgi:DNA-binding NtrC family response regulator